MVVFRESRRRVDFRVFASRTLSVAVSVLFPGFLYRFIYFFESPFINDVSTFISYPFVVLFVMLIVWPLSTYIDALTCDVFYL